MAAHGSSGYWLVAADGGVFSFGDRRRSRGRPATSRWPSRSSGMAPGRRGGGYWMVAADGGIFAFGDAGFYGSMPQVLAAAGGPD